MFKKKLLRSALCFYFSLLIPLFVFAQSAETNTPAPLSLENLAFDETVGKVEERFIGTGNRVIIQVQDVHAHAVAQENIAAILERLSSVYGIKKVALEGAWSETDLPKSRAIPTSREKQLLARSLMEEDLISGPVYAAILSPSPITLVGIENAGLYEKNRQLFLKHLSKVPGIEIKLAAYDARLKKTEETLWNPELLAFGTAFGKFRETGDLGDFFSTLVKTANARSVDLSDLEQIVLLRDITALEKEFTKERLKQEVKKLLREYKNTPWNLEEMIRGGKIPEERIGFYPELAKLARLYKMRDQISLRELMSQLETLTGKVLASLVKTEGEEALWNRVERFYLAKSILLLKATPADLAVLEKEKAAMETEVQEANLQEEMALALAFYDVAKERDRIFYEKLANDPRFSGPIIVVTGGFHTAGLSEQLRDAGISYVTISPDLGKEKGNEELYKKRMEDGGWRKTQNQLHPSSAALRADTLSELQNIIADADNRFPDAYDVFRQTNNLRKATDAFEGRGVEVSSSEKISGLKAKGQLRRGTSKGSISVSELRVDEFMKKPRPEQLGLVSGWLAQGPEAHARAMLVSSVSSMGKMLADENVPGLIRQISQNGDILVLIQDVPADKVPEPLLNARRFETTDLDALLQKTPHFQRLAKQHPFAVMKEGYQNNSYVVLPEHPASLVLYRIVTLNANLYQAAKNPEFLAILQDLVMEILSERLAGKAA